MPLCLLWLITAQAQAQNCLDCDEVVADLGEVLSDTPQATAAGEPCVPPSGHLGISSLAIQQTPEGANYSPELLAFMRAITYTEGSEKADGYYTEVGGRVYPSSTNIHPGASDVYRYSKTGHNSDAYGKYQMLSSTWAEWAGKAGIPTAKSGRNSYGEPYYDMSPENQDKAVLGFLQREGIENILTSRGLDAALRTWQAQQWASVPGASQPNDRTGSFRSVYNTLLAEERANKDAAKSCGAAIARATDPGDTSTSETSSPSEESTTANSEASSDGNGTNTASSETGSASSETGSASSETDSASSETDSGIANDPSVPLDVPYAYQYDNTVASADSATATSVSMMLAHYGAEVSPDHIIKSWGAAATQDPEGFAEIFNHYAELHGLEERLVARTDGTLEDLEAQLQSGDPVPVHAYTTPSGGVLVATGYTESTWTVNDPTGRWNQRFKGGYPRWGHGAGKGATYNRGPFVRAVATWNGYTPAPIWWHEVVRP